VSQWVPSDSHTDGRGAHQFNVRNRAIPIFVKL